MILWSTTKLKVHYLHLPKITIGVSSPFTIATNLANVLNYVHATNPHIWPFTYLCHQSIAPNACTMSGAVYIYTLLTVELFPSVWIFPLYVGCSSSVQCTSAHALLINYYYCAMLNLLFYQYAACSACIGSYRLMKHVHKWPGMAGGWHVLCFNICMA